MPLAAWCQLRLGELLGLERRDADALHGTIRIERTAYDVAGKLHIGPPKTAAGVRTVTIPPHILRDLERHLMTYVGPEPSAPIFTGQNGGRLGRHPLNQSWSVARAVIGRQEEVHFHDLRHAGLTWAATQGVTSAELMKRAGHASRAAGLRYQYATEDRDAAIAQALSVLAHAAQSTRVRSGTRDIRAMKSNRDRRASHHVRRPPPASLRAADRDRTGIISLEVRPPRIQVNPSERNCRPQYRTNPHERR